MGDSCLPLPRVFSTYQTPGTAQTARKHHLIILLNNRRFDLSELWCDLDSPHARFASSCCSGLLLGFRVAWTRQAAHAPPVHHQKIPFGPERGLAPACDLTKAAEAVAALPMAKNQLQQQPWGAFSG